MTVCPGSKERSATKARLTSTVQLSDSLAYMRSVSSPCFALSSICAVLVLTSVSVCLQCVPVAGSVRTARGAAPALITARVTPSTARVSVTPAGSAATAHSVSITLKTLKLLLCQILACTPTHVKIQNHSFIVVCCVLGESYKNVLPVLNGKVPKQHCPVYRQPFSLCLKILWLSTHFLSYHTQFCSCQISGSGGFSRAV